MLDFLPYLLLYFLCFVTVFTNNKRTYCSLFIVFIVFTLISGFRYKVGVDYKNYQTMHELIRDGANTYLEPAYQIFVEISYFVTNSDQLVFLIVSVLTLAMNFKFINQFSQWRSLSYFTYLCLPFLYLATFNQMRQFLAASIFFFVVSTLRKRKFISVCLLCVAVLFHKSAIILVFIYFVIDKPLTLRWIITGIVFYLFLILGFNVIFKLIGFSEMYLNSSDGNSGVNLVITSFFLLSLVIHFSVNYIYPGYTSEVKKHTVLFNMLFACVLISVTPIFLTAIDSGNILRFLSYFSISIAVVIPNSMLIVYKKNKMLSYLILFLYLTFLSISYFNAVIFHGFKYELVPYQFRGIFVE